MIYVFHMFPLNAGRFGHLFNACCNFRPALFSRKIFGIEHKSWSSSLCIFSSSCYFLSLISKYSSRTCLLKCPQPLFVPFGDGPVVIVWSRTRRDVNSQFWTAVGCPVHLVSWSALCVCMRSADKVRKASVCRWWGRTSCRSPLCACVFSGNTE
jgi:hypothetical protein